MLCLLEHSSVVRLGSGAGFVQLKIQTCQCRVSGVSGVAWHIRGHGVGVSLGGSSEEFS